MKLDDLKREVLSKVCDKVEDEMHYRGAEEMFDYLTSHGLINLTPYGWKYINA